MKLFIAPRAGIWCRHLSGWDAWREAMRQPLAPDQVVAEPWPDCLPARECRRSPLHVRLAIEVAARACRENAVVLGGVATVFASAMGDSEITDYMCRTLAGAEPALSPTRFHNSVHNAASGYWSIAAGNRLPSTAVAAGPHTLSMALLEAGLMAASMDCPVLMVCHDVSAPPPLDEVAISRQPYAVGLLLAGIPVTRDWRPLEMTAIAGFATEAPSVPPWATPAECDANLLAALGLLHGLAASEPARFQVALGNGSRLEMALAACHPGSLWGAASFSD